MTDLTIATEGHDYANGYCSICNTRKPSEGLKYILSYNKLYYTVTGIGTCTDSDLIIPSVYEGLPVKEIGDSAFKKCTSLTSVTIPDNVTKIGYYAFSGCTSLTSITLGNGERVLELMRSKSAQALRAYISQISPHGVIFPFLQGMQILSILQRSFI